MLNIGVGRQMILLYAYIQIPYIFGNTSITITIISLPPNILHFANTSITNTIISLSPNTLYCGNIGITTSIISMSPNALHFGNTPIM